MATISQLSSHSNITAICTKYKIWKSVLEEIVKSNSCKLTNLLIPITGEKSSNNWDYAKKGLVDAFREQIVKNTEFNALAGVSALGNEKFAELIADSIISQLKNEDANRGWLNWFSGEAVSINFNYGTTIAIKKLNSPILAEYLEISGDGKVSCDKNWVNDNKMKFEINLTVKGVTIKGDDIEYYTEGKVQGPTIVKELSWFGVDQQHTIS